MASCCCFSDVRWQQIELLLLASLTITIIINHTLVADLLQPAYKLYF